MGRLSFPTIFKTAGILLAFSLISACGQTVSNLPTANGGLDEVVVMEDARFKHDTLILKTLSQKLQGNFGLLLSPEPRYDVLYNDMRAIEAFKLHRNLVFIGVLDEANQQNQLITSLIGENRAKKIKEGDQLYYLERANIWSNGQVVRFLVAPDRETMIAGMADAADKLATSIDRMESGRFHNLVYGIGNDLVLEQELRDKHDIHMQIPELFKKLSSSKDNFYFLRRSTVAMDAMLMIYYEPYTKAEMVTPEYAINVRDSLGRFEGSTVPGSYMATEQKLPPLVDTINLNGYFTIRQQGLWRLRNDFVGGVFVNYWIYDEKNQRMVYIDGYLNAPGMKKRKILKEMETILQTFGIEQNSAA